MGFVLEAASRAISPVWFKAMPALALTGASTLAEAVMPRLFGIVSADSL